MKTRSLFRLAGVALLGLLFLPACASSEKVTDLEGPETLVHVTNRNWLSMEVYAVRDTRRHRLGRVGSGKTRDFSVPYYMLSGATPIRFEMESDDPTTRVVLSERIIVVPGEEVILVIPSTR